MSGTRDQRPSRERAYEGPFHLQECGQGKQGYTSKRALLRALRQTGKKYGKVSAANIYRCDSCDLYHYTSTPKIGYMRYKGLA